MGRGTVSDNNLANQEESLMQTYQRFPLTVEKGKGSYIWDDRGKKYLDFTSGIATCNLGHVPDVVKSQIIAQIEELWHCSNLFHIPVQQKLAQLLTTYSFGDQVFFCNSGAEANEAAIKLARKYAKKVKETHAYEVVTFSQSFHGRTLATLSATGQNHVKEDYAPLASGFRHLPYNDFEALNNLVTPDTCAVLVEVVQGEGGVIPADQSWLKQLAAICKENNLLLIFDEVQTGMGRTGTLFAYEQYGVTPDVMTLAKGLGSGIPVGAVIATEEVAKAFGPGTHGTTFGGNPIACTAGIATLNYMIENDVCSTTTELGEYLSQQLQQLKEQCPVIEKVQGKGLLQGMALKIPAKDIVNKARGQGVLLLTAGSHVLRVLPPLTTTYEEIDEFISKLYSVLFQVETERGTLR